MRAPTEARFPQQQEKSLPFIDKCCRSVGDVKVWLMGRYGPTITHVFIRSFKCCCKHARQPSHAWFVDVTSLRSVERGNTHVNKACLLTTLAIQRIFLLWAQIRDSKLLFNNKVVQTHGFHSQVASFGWLIPVRVCCRR